MFSSGSALLVNISYTLNLKFAWHAMVYLAIVLSD